MKVKAAVAHVAAVHGVEPCVALAGRPESLLSGGRCAGQVLLVDALEWLRRRATH